jgi:hypothetical protein
MALTQINNTVSDTANLTANNTSFLGGVPAASYAQTANLPAGGFSNMQVFTSSGTFTVPTGITKVKVTVVGGGGGGGSFNSGSYLGGGGGGAAIEIISGLTPGGTVSVTVGAGGAYNATGGTSSFGAFCSATGGAPTGLGGLGSGGQLNIRGGGGSYGFTNFDTGDYEVPGGGGSSILGGGAPANANANAGGAYGGGGRSQFNQGNGTAGSAGIVVVEW